MMSKITGKTERFATHRLLLALFASTLLAATAPARAGDPPTIPQTATATAQTEGRLALVPEENVQANGPTAAYRDFGTLDALNTKRLEQTFHLRNAGTAPIAINYIQPSCGCASIVLSTEGSRDPYLVAPGAQVAVRVTIDMNRVHAGQLSKLAIVYLKGESRPAFILEMRGILPPLVTVTPRVLDFGRLDPGVGRTLTVNVAIDKRLLAATPPPKLICNNPDIEIAPQNEAVAAPAVATTPPDAKTDAKTDEKTDEKTVTRTYTVTLARNARLGVVGGAIGMVPGNVPAAKPLPTPYGVSALIPDALGDTSIISGQIIGKFSAIPYLVVFGSVLQGRDMTRRVQLTGATAEILQDLTFSCSLPTLSARLVPQPKIDASQPPTANGARPTAMMEVTLNAQTPAGGLSGEVIVTARDGERLVIPVIGDVIKVEPQAKTP